MEVFDAAQLVIAIPMEKCKLQSLGISFTLGDGHEHETVRIF